MNTILTVIHALKLSSLTYSLQIYCIGLTGPRSHTSWAWAAKRVPTIKRITEGMKISKEKLSLLH